MGTKSGNINHDVAIISLDSPFVPSCGLYPVVVTVTVVVVVGDKYRNSGCVFCGCPDGVSYQRKDETSGCGTTLFDSRQVAESGECIGLCEDGGP